jgi:hypothetical protein
MQATVLSWTHEEALFAIIAGAVIACASFIFLWRSFKRYRLIHDTPTSRIRSAAQGFVELFGTAKLLEGEPILSPLSRQPCCWWHYRIERRVRSGKTTRWSTVESGTSEGIFALEDGTGQALVDPLGAEVSGSKDKTWYGNSRHPGDMVSGISMFGGSYRYCEEILPAGSQLYVLGNLKSEDPAGEFDLHQAVGEKLRQWKQNQAQLLMRFDSNGDGEIDEQEWAKARQVAKDELTQQYASLIEQEPIHLMRKPDRGLPMLLSSFAPQKLAKRYLLKTLLAGPLFLAAGAFAIWVASLRELI